MTLLLFERRRSSVGGFKDGRRRFYNGLGPKCEWAWLQEFKPIILKVERKEELVNAGMEGSEEDLEMELDGVLRRVGGELDGEFMHEVGSNRGSRKLRNVLVLMQEKLSAMKRVVGDRWLKAYGCITSDLDRTRAYQVWPGNNVFFFHGRLICGPDPRGLLLTTISIILSSWIFSMYGGDDLPSHSGLVVAFSSILTVIVLVNLALISAIDPGIIPRNDQAPEEVIGSSNGTRRKKVITINGVELRLKYCRICKMFRPPRSCHCAICDNCVEKFDHHCPWVGQCIALRNYRFYLTFVTSALGFFAYIFAFSCLRIRRRMLRTGAGLLGMIKNRPETVALLLFSFAAICFLGGLAIFHAYLIAVNQTAYESYRDNYIKRQNPFDKGILSNIKEVLFGPWPPSRVDFRAEVTPRAHQNVERG